MYRSFTRSLLKPLNLQAAMYALISQLTLVCNMQLNVLDDLAEAMKALDGKKDREVFTVCKMAAWSDTRRQCCSITLASAE